MKISNHPALRMVLALALLASITGATHAQGARLTSELLNGFKFRSIGPAVTGGRIHDVEALPNDPSTIYLATASGGLFMNPGVFT